MELQISEDVVIEEPNLDLIIIKFCQDLRAELHMENQRLEEACAKRKERIRELLAEGKNLFETIWISENRNINCEGKVYLYHLNQSNIVWTTSLQHGFLQIEQGVSRHRDYCNEWKQSVQQKLQDANDDFTMMSFHDVEQEVKRISEEIYAVQRATTEIISQTELFQRNMQTKFKGIAEEISLLEEYRKEMKNEKDKYQQIKRQHQLDAFSSYADGKQLAKLQKEINQLQQEISDIKQNHST